MANTIYDGHISTIMMDYHHNEVIALQSVLNHFEYLENANIVYLFQHELSFDLWPVLFLTKVIFFLISASCKHY